MRKFLIEGLLRRPLTETAPKTTDDAVEQMGKQFRDALHPRLGRSLSVRMVDAGSCNGCEMEINALANPFYDLERFGLRFVASPRHADVLMVTGPVTRNMAEALKRTHDGMPEPKWVVAVGDCARDGGCFVGSYAIVGGISAVLPVDLYISGCPPSPTQLLQGLLALLEHTRTNKANSPRRCHHLGDSQIGN